MTTDLALRDHSFELSPFDSLTAYLSRIRQFERLSAEDEADLARRFRVWNDLEAARRLVLSHLRFVVHVARSYTGYGLALPDLIQEGNVGLMKAVKRFDPDQGVRLVSFAIHWIKAEIHEFVIANWRIFKVATTKAQRKLFFNLGRLRNGLHRLTLQEAKGIAQELDVEVEEVYEMEQRMSGADIPLEFQGEVDEEMPAWAPIDTLASETGDPQHTMETMEWDEARHSALANALKALDERSRQIVTRRWLGDGQGTKATLGDLAAEYGVSAERIRQIESQALKRLRSHMNVALPA